MIQAVTRGAPLSWTYLLSSIRPMDHIFTGIYESSAHGEKIVGQIYQSQNMSSAHLNYALLTKNSHHPDLIPLLEGLITKAGHWGSKQVVANLETKSELFPFFRQVGFSVLAKQRIYQCAHPKKMAIQNKGEWRIWNRDDIGALRSLYLTLVPPLIQPVEPLSRREMLGLVYYDDEGTLQAYADLVYGPVGAWVLPLIHPKTKEEISDVLLQMVLNLPDLNHRPVYIAARSYQPWVENALENLPMVPAPEQVILIRYLTIQQRVHAEYSFAGIENGKAETTLPLASAKSRREG